MKKMKLLVLAMMFSPVLMWAQQDGINYQAAVRDGSGVLITNQAVATTFKIRQGTVVGTIVYEETHNPMTNDYGLINVVIGEGSVVSGTFDAIDWGSDTYFIDIAIDGNNLGAFELKSVPYAHHSKSMTNIRANQPTGDVKITSEDSHATLYINPEVNAFNDSSSIVFGEGTANYNMSILYDGDSDELKFNGKVGATTYGPHLTIKRNTGVSTFAKGVEVQQTTTNPAPNRVYGNSGPLAYCYVWGTTLLADYGITSVTNPATGEYVVTLNNAWDGYPVVAATSQNAISDSEVITYTFQGNNVIRIRIVNESNIPVASNFSLVVYGTAL